MKRPVCAFLLVAALIFVPVASQAADAEKVRELLEVMDASKALNSIKSALFPQLVKMLISAENERYPHLPPDAPEIVSEAADDLLKSMVPDLMIAEQKIYADIVTDQETEAAIAFYRTSAGRSYAREMPKTYVSGQPPALTDEERNAVIAFFNSPAGQSLKAKMPAVMQQLDQATQTWMSHRAGQLDRHFDQLLYQRHPELKKK